MSEEKRQWWKVRRVWGVILGGTSAALLSIPIAPVLLTVGGVAITTQTIAIVTGFIATNVFSYGQGKANERTNK